jgi:predicted phosphodiesterase
MSWAKTVSRGLASVVATLLFAAGVQAADIDLTFFGWADQHVATDGTALPQAYASVAAMNRLPGVAYPESIGGTVAKPEFVFGAGDFTEWPTAASVETYKKLEGMLEVPSYDIAGNHDDGGEMPAPAAIDWLKQKYGGLSYTFEKGGVHFICADSKFDAKGTPNQPLTEDCLTYIKTNIAKVPKGEPVVVAIHMCFEAITNPDALVDSFGDANVALVMTGHYHQPSTQKYRGISFVQCPSPKSDTHAGTAVHITSERVTAVPYNYDKNTWMTGNVVLDAKLPATATAK